VENYRDVAIELKKMLTPEGVMVQMIGFSNPTKQLLLLLKVLTQCGFVEARYKSLANGDDGRL
jgi:hypothetical protein